MSSEFDDLALAIALSVSAGSAILHFRERGFDVLEKSDHTPVTEADLASNRIITEGLRSHRPKHGILSEESPFIADQPKELWVIDPLDGTEGFIDGSSRGFAVQIAKLSLNESGHYTVRLGVTYEPLHGELLFAARSLGAFQAEVETSELSLDAARAIIAGANFVRPKRGDNSAPLPATLKLIRSKRIPDSFLKALLAQGMSDSGPLRSVGVKVGRLLEDSNQLYVAHHDLSWWDLAAPQVILECAGGRVSDLGGNAPVYSALNLVEKPVTSGPLIFTRGLSHELSRELVSHAFEHSKVQVHM